MAVADAPVCFGFFRDAVAAAVSTAGPALGVARTIRGAVLAVFSHFADTVVVADTIRISGTVGISTIRPSVAIIIDEIAAAQLC